MCPKNCNTDELHVKKGAERPKTQQSGRCRRDCSRALLSLAFITCMRPRRRRRRAAAGPAPRDPNKRNRLAMLRETKRTKTLNYSTDHISIVTSTKKFAPEAAYYKFDAINQ